MHLSKPTLDDVLLRRTGRSLRDAGPQDMGDTGPGRAGLGDSARRCQPIAQAGTPEHVKEHRGALDLRLSEVDLATIDGAFPPPRGPRPPEML